MNKLVFTFRLAKIYHETVLDDIVILFSVSNGFGDTIGDLAKISFCQGLQFAKLVCFDPTEIICRRPFFYVSWYPFDMVPKILESFKEHDFLRIQRIGGVRNSNLLLTHVPFAIGDASESSH